MHTTEPSDSTTTALLNEHAAPADTRNMTIRSLTRMSLVAIAVPPGFWIAGASPAVASAAGVVAAVALVAWASVHIVRRNRRRTATVPSMLPAVAAPEPALAPAIEIEFPERRLGHAPPTGRQPRDVRCPARSGMIPRGPRSARRSTRR